MESKLIIIKTLFNSIVSRINQLEQLNLSAKQFYETILNAQDQLKAIQNGVNLEEFQQQIDNDTFLHLELEIKISYIRINRNNIEYAEIVNKLCETINNLHIIETQLIDQKKQSGKLGQFILMLNELDQILQEYQKQSQLRDMIIQDKNVRYALLNFIHKTEIEERTDFILQLQLF